MMGFLQLLSKSCHKHNARALMDVTEHGRLRVFETVIPRSIRFAAAPAYQQLPAVLTDAQNPLVAAYFRLYEEVFAP